jgi:transmembrane sensor
MSEREEELDLAIEHVNMRWTPQQTERALGKFHRRIERRARAAKVGLGVAGIAAFAWLAGPRVAELYRSAADAHSEQADVREGDRAPITFSDGSRLTALDPQTRVSVLEAVPERIVAGVDRGSVRFEVSHHPERVFRALAGDVSVEALGTIFTVERLDLGVWVSVSRGKVRVEWPGGSRELATGEADWFPPKRGEAIAAASAAGPGAASSEVEDIAAEDNAPRAQSAGDGARAKGWKALAQQGKHSEAYAALGSLAPGQVQDAEELLAAADVARLSGHPKRAVPFLERVLTQFRRDPRAPVAAFSLGRILMTSLDSPAKAAQRFAEVRSLAPGGSLGEDALAREVEAWSLAGQLDRAHERAQEYVRLYPRGQRLSTVRKFGGIE